jgi:hypothetical protein
MCFKTTEDKPPTGMAASSPKTILPLSNNRGDIKDNNTNVSPSSVRLGQILVPSTKILVLFIALKESI